jgi:glycosyltransferase involved in cell wall biosynthesis
MERWHLDAVDANHNSLTSTVAGVVYALRHPARCALLASWLVRSMWATPRFLLRALLLVPRSLDILAAIEKSQPDVVHLFWGHYPAAVGFLVHRYCPKTILSMFLGAYDLEWAFGTSAPVARSADVLWTHAHANVPAIVLLGVARDRIHVAHRGIELGRFADLRPRKVPGRIVTAGRLHPSKGMGDVIEVLAGILRRRPDASLVIVGDGPDRARLETLAHRLGVAHAVSFLGRVSHDTVLQELASAELFVYMSTDVTDRLPNVVKEAVASRCVCVVSRTTGIDELIRHGIDGWVVERGDVERAIAHACDALSDRDRSAAMVVAANEHLLAEFDVDRSMRHYLEQWSDLLESDRDQEVAGPGERFVLAGEPGAHESARQR